MLRFRQPMTVIVHSNGVDLALALWVLLPGRNKARFHMLRSESSSSAGSATPTLGLFFRNSPRFTYPPAP